jgi:hypothetical protein
MQSAKGECLMSETHAPDSNDPVPAQEIDEAHGQSDSEADSEFRLTVRKLQLPVRPRGVLAE